MRTAVRGNSTQLAILLTVARALRAERAASAERPAPGPANDMTPQGPELVRACVE